MTVVLNAVVYFNKQKFYLKEAVKSIEKFPHN